MPDFSKRSSAIEIMDDLNSSGAIIDQTLRELEFINTWLGGNAVTLRALDKVVQFHRGIKTLTIADLGCGGGDMLRLINDWAIKRNIQVQLTGIDANLNIIAYAKKNVPLSNVQFCSVDIFSEAFKTMNFDVVVGTLFFHHFTSDQLIGFFRQLRQQVKLAVIINDIHRHPLAYHSIAMLTKAFSKSTMVIHDAPLSVLRAFSKDELRFIIDQAGYTKYTIKWKWAFRWEVVVYPS